MLNITKPGFDIFLVFLHQENEGKGDRNKIYSGERVVKA